MVLLVIDAQKEITNEKLYKFDEFVYTVKMLIKTARENGVEGILNRLWPPRRRRGDVHDRGSGGL